MTDFVIALHLLSLGVAAAGIVLADHSAWRWMRGHEDQAHRETIFRLHVLVTAGLCGLVLTGLYLFWPLRDYLLYQPLFWVKMAFVATLIINSLFIETLMHTATTHPFRALSLRKKAPLIISGAVSTCSWLGTVATAILLFRWPFL